MPPAGKARLTLKKSPTATVAAGLPQPRLRLFAKDMDWLLTCFSSESDWRIVVVAGAVCLAASICAFALFLRVRRQLRERYDQLAVALNNMSQGLCMFGGDERLVIFNQRYIEMYGLSADVVKTGSTFIEILRHRVERGNLAGDAEHYRTDLLAYFARGEMMNKVVDSGRGRMIRVINKPLPGGGWVGTHEDITERWQLEKQRDDISAQEARRVAIDHAISAFRERVESVLRVVSDSASSMKSTALTLSNSSEQTSQRAEGAV